MKIVKIKLCVEQYSLFSYSPRILLCYKNQQGKHRNKVLALFL